MLRVLHVTPSFFPAFAYGGPTRSTYELARHTAGLENCDVMVLTTNANGAEVLEYPDPLQKLGDSLSVRYCRRNMGEAVSLALLRWLPKEIARADIVHLTAAYSFPTIPTLLLCRLMRKPVVWSTRGAFLQWQGTRKRRMKAIWDAVCRRVLPPLCIIHTTSNAERQAATERFPRAESLVVGNGVDVPSAEPAQSRAGKSFRVGFLGRLDPIKGIENLILGFHLAGSDRDWVLRIGGTGDRRYERALRELVDVLAEAHRVKFLGFLSDDEKEAFFANLDVLVLPSYSENFGIVVAEALAHGVPVIASTGSPWLRLEEMFCGMTADNSPEALASAMEKMRNADLTTMGRRGRKWMQQEFSWTEVANRMYKMYEKLLHA